MDENTGKTKKNQVANVVLEEVSRALGGASPLISLSTPQPTQLIAKLIKPNENSPTNDPIIVIKQNNVWGTVAAEIIVKSECTVVVVISCSSSQHFGQQLSHILGNIHLPDNSCQNLEVKFEEPF